MPRLAIVIPAIGNVERLEATLLSVLESRPRDCEVIVAANFAYADPYDLRGEVRFVDVPCGADFVTCSKLATRTVRAPFIHMLAAGCEASEGWTDAALKRFGDPRIAAVAPLVLRSSDRTRVLAAGIAYHCGGVRRQIVAKPAKLEANGSADVFGACSFAGFFRRSALETVGGWNIAAGTSHADVELAWALQRAGYRAVSEPAARIYAAVDQLPSEGSFRHAFHAERVFWRNAGSVGWLKALAAHPLAVALDTLSRVPGPATVLRLAGRLWAVCQVGHYLRHYHRLRHQGQPADIVPMRHAQDPMRVDARRSVGDKRTGKGEPKRARSA